MFNKKVRTGLLVVAAVGMIGLLFGCGAQVQAGGGGTLRSATYAAAGDNAYTINVSGSGLASSTPVMSAAAVVASNAIIVPKPTAPISTAARAATDVRAPSAMASASLALS